MTNREITLTSPLPPDELRFAELVGFDEIGRPFDFELRAVSERLDIAAKDLLGHPVTVTVKHGAGGEGGAPRHIHALITDFGFLDERGGLGLYRATLRPALWLASLTTNNRIFQKKSVVDIVTAVLKAYSPISVVNRLKRNYPPRDYCVQYGESDLDFVQRLMEHEGILYFFEHARERHNLVLADAGTPLKPPPGLDALPWQADERLNFLDGDFVVQWASTTTIRTRAYAHTDYDFTKPTANLMARSQGDESFKGDRSEQYHYPGTYTEFARGDSLGTIRREEIGAAGRRARARCTAPGLHSGVTFDLKGYPREEENDRYMVLRTDYRLWDGQYRAGWQGYEGDAWGCEIDVELQPTALPFQPERRTPYPQMKGPQTAVVVGPAGSEIYTDNHSRVKVQFHWDREGGKDENSSCWVRVSTAWAGAGWGFIQIPRIGQEVVVDFLEGDPDQPIITGRVYNAGQMPPYGLPDNATQSGWKSNSSPGGGGWNELRFEDKKGSEQVYFQAEKDHKELVKHDENRAIGHDWTEDVGHDAAQSVGNDRAETVGHDKSTTVKNNRTVEIGANDTEHVGANRSLTVDANETIHVKANSTESIDINHTQTVGGVQTITIKAARVDSVLATETRSVALAQTMTVGAVRVVGVGANQSHSVKVNDSTDVGANQTFKIGANHATDVGAGQTLKVKADQGTDVGGGRTVKVGKSQAHDVAQDIAAKAGKNVVIEAGDSITLTCGSATVSMKKDGTITIKGKNITIDGSGKINAKAGGDMTLKGSKIHEN